MIVVKLEMWPQGDQAKAYSLGRIFLWNKVKTTVKNPKRGDYEYAVMHKSAKDTVHPNLGKVVRTGVIKDYPRLSYTVWKLILLCLKDAFDKP